LIIVKSVIPFEVFAVHEYGVVLKVVLRLSRVSEIRQPIGLAEGQCTMAKLWWSVFVNTASGSITQLV